MEKTSLNSGEEMILKAQGHLQFGASWKQGHFFLTNRRLFFTPIAKKLFEVSLDQITEMSIAKRSWLLGVRVKQLCISYSAGLETEQVYITLAEPKKWVEEIKESMTLMLAERWSYNGANPELPGNTE
ncbi:hypothetical protein [Desulfosporosinus nitroreducens]|uniref:hypothetical protein n=1 Tax=Desulfosporosinus nitroreducens TaxID=2018668 RepID=UPI00207CA83C|nr:hypothetical protein [Desulfosporosinus nitroreducens]MCO1603064.1 hypothetical protein [Desulfosporosinus nitroreducens]